MPGFSPPARPGHGPDHFAINLELRDPCANGCFGCGHADIGNFRRLLQALDLRRRLYPAHLTQQLSAVAHVGAGREERALQLLADDAIGAIAPELQSNRPFEPSFPPEFLHDEVGAAAQRGTRKIARIDGMREHSAKNRFAFAVEQNVVIMIDMHGDG